MNSGKPVFALAMVVLLWSQSAEAACALISSERDLECYGTFECVDSFDNLRKLITVWDCISGINREVDVRVDIHTQFHAYFWITIKMEHIILSETNLYEIHYLFDHILSISYTNPTITMIPQLLLRFPKLHKLDVSKNNISCINLLDLRALEYLLVFNASFNSIRELRTLPTNYTSVSLSVPNLSTIDVSHNAIKVVDDNYFREFRNVRHLNISYNLIESFSIITFEGLTDLETLDASNNKIKEINMNFARFTNLKVLSLEHNYLTVIEKINFKMMSKLVKLNLSYNKIHSIDDVSFQNLKSLKNVQLQGNFIKVVTKPMFISNNALQLLDISNNEINKIDSYIFRGKNIKYFMIEKNNLSYLDESIFEGIDANILDLSMNNITSLGPELFSGLNKSLRYLNFSCNSLSNIHEQTFKSLQLLTELDLSKNQLTSLNFRTSDLITLSVFNAKNNFISEIRRNTFKNLENLRIIDLSNNVLANIDESSFKDLKRLDVLDLSNSKFASTKLSSTFRGLSSITSLNLNHASTSKLLNETFYGMKKLQCLNISYGKFSELEYNGFINTGLISILDISYNSIHTFRVNNTDLRFLTKLYLNNNNIESITSETLKGLSALKILNLDYNNIIRIDSNTLRNLQNVVKLILSSNVNMVFDSSIFSHLNTTSVSLHNVQKPFTFENVENTLISNLDISSCNITDLNVIKVGNLAKLENLILSSNKVKYIDKYSLQNLSALVSLDLSSNMISSIQPGSFMDLRMMTYFNLYDNNLSLLQFGVFDGLSHLRYLNLSSNLLKTFQPNIFHNSHMLWIISLDDNMINNIDFEEINKASIPKVTIGGNLIPCEQLAKSKKKSYYGVSVTAEKINLSDENVDGISCKGIFDTSTKISTENAVLTDINVSTQAENLKKLNDQLIVNSLTDLKFAVYFESSCLVFLIVLLLVGVLFVHIKLKSNLVRSYSLGSTRQLTASCADMEL